MKDRILLLTKDAFCKEYLPAYGNKYWAGKTPNIDELVKKGTKFNRHYTAAPSTVMAFRAMVTGKFAYEQPYSNYTPKEVSGSETDLFEVAKQKGYAGHIIWDSAWVQMVLRYGNCYGADTQIHNLPEIRQGVGCHYNHTEPLKNNDELCNATLDRIVKEVESIIEKDDKVFIWMHLPHVINGRTSYGSDIDMFDKLIGMLREYFDDNNIFISADHGNMNGHNKKYCYGFDVHTSNIEIPLIAPRIQGLEEYDHVTSNVDIKSMIFDRKIIQRDFVYSDCAYYAQPHRILAIVNDEFSYIYFKETDKEELYDMTNDKWERCNLLNDSLYDVDRKVTSPVREYFFSPYWDSAEEIANQFRETKAKIWRNASKAEESKEKYKRKAIVIAENILKIFRK
jgi:hypothetical protein